MMIASSCHCIAWTKTPSLRFDNTGQACGPEPVLHSKSGGKRRNGRKAAGTNWPVAELPRRNTIPGAPMRYLPFAALLLAVPAGPAAAQSPDLEKACLAVAQNFLLAPTIKTGVVQSFPELEPPGARMTYSTREEDR